MTINFWFGIVLESSAAIQGLSLNHIHFNISFIFYWHSTYIFAFEIFTYHFVCHNRDVDISVCMQPAFDWQYLPFLLLYYMRPFSFHCCCNHRSCVHPDTKIPNLSVFITLSCCVVYNICRISNAATQHQLGL